jgi:XTP/dITP diphosphohydrolase
MKILIATTNQGKFVEFTSQFSDFKFEFLNLKDVGLGEIDLEEPYETTWENAVHKARFFGEKSGLMTIAEDTGFYVDALNKEPGVKAKRFAPTPEERNQKILDGLKGKPWDQRTARFITHACIYNPTRKNFTIVEGGVMGKITESVTGTAREGVGYDAIFHYPPLEKTFAELSVAEKNTISHRGHAIRQLKIYLQNQFAFKQILCPIAIVVKDRKLLATKRRDTNPQFNGKWEFPGGGIDKGEEVEVALKREALEETGLVVSIMERLPGIFTTTMEFKDGGGYQVFLLPYICTIESGEVYLADEESSDYGWYTLEDALKIDFIPLNKKVIQESISLLKKYID